MLHTDQIIKLLQSNKQALFGQYPLTEIGVFGSVVRDDFTEKSDIDIIIDYNKPMGIEFIDLANTLEKIVHRKVDLVSKKGIKLNYFKQIENEIIYV
jgi:predicted nucleotidyltransferase